MHFIILFVLLLTAISGCSQDLIENPLENEITSSIATRAVSSNDFYTDYGISIKNSGTGPETYYGGTTEYYEAMVEYYNDDENKRTSPNSVIRINWAKVEDENGYHFEEILDQYFIRSYKYKQKICLAIFPIDYLMYNTIPTTAEYRGKLRKAYIGYPLYIHQQLMQSTDYRPRLYQNYDGSITDENSPLYYAPDLRNPIIYEKYRDLMVAFRKYIDEEVEFEGRKLCRKQLIREIQIRFWGFYGEGYYPYLGDNRETITDISEYDAERSEDLLRWGKIYLDIFPDIRLVAPTIGMWASELLCEYQYWLATASNQCGEFGLFIDSWGDNGKTAIYSSTIEWNGQKLTDILKDKWKVAPIGGEPMPVVPKSGAALPYSKIVEQVKLVRPVKFAAANLTTGYESNNSTHWKATEEKEGALFKEAYSIMGYRIIQDDISCDVRDIFNRIIQLKYKLQNIGLTPVYEPWDICYVFRDTRNHEKKFIYKSSFDIRRIMPSEDPNEVLHVRDDGWVQVEDEISNIPHGMYDIYLKISDPDEIVPNMRLSQPGYDDNGEYYLDTIIY